MKKLLVLSLILNFQNIFAQNQANVEIKIIVPEITYFNLLKTTNDYDEYLYKSNTLKCTEKLISKNIDFIEYDKNFLNVNFDQNSIKICPITKVVIKNTNIKLHYNNNINDYNVIYKL